MFQFLQSIDTRILFYIQELRNPVIDRIMVFITTLGNAGFLWILIAFLFLTQKRYQKAGIPLFCAISLAMILGDNILKPLVGRVRPCNLFPEISMIIQCPQSPSFPSGHTMVGFASATVIYYYFRRFGWIAYGIASLIAFSRLYLFVHYPSDVLGGIALGILHGLIVPTVLNHAFVRTES